MGRLAPQKRKLDRGHKATIIEHVRALVFLCVMGALAITLGAAVLWVYSSTSDQTDRLATGRIFSTDAGDNVDVEVLRDSETTRCLQVSGFRYPSATSCFGMQEAATRGPYQVVIRTKVAVPPLVIGVMPSNVIGARVRVGSDTTQARVRGRWFLAALEPGALGPNNSAPVSVEFSGG